MEKKRFDLDFDATLRWVQRKHPEMSYSAAERFATNIIRKKEAERLAEKTSHIPNLDGRPLKKRFEIIRFRHVSSYIVTDLADHQTQKVYGHSWRTLGQAEKWLTDELDYIVKHIPTNTNLYVDNSADRPKLQGHIDMFCRTFDFSDDIKGEGL